MRIISYNINGLGAFATKNKLSDLMYDFPADVYCFQEVKADAKKVDKILSTHIEGYLYFGSVNDYKKGYAGVATLVKETLKDQICDWHEQTFNYNGDYTYTAGRIVTIEFNKFYLVNVYVVNSGNKEEIRKDFDIQFMEYLKSLPKPYIVCGDFNVCATELDYWGNYKKAINSGPGLMDFEIEGFNNMITECGLTDAFRVFHKYDRAYSWFSPRRGAIYKGQGWRLDYFLVSKELLQDIDACDVMEKYQGPDHSPISLYI